MLTVRTRLGESQIEGVGVFAVEDIPKGTIVWKFHPGLDRYIHKKQIAMLEPAVREQIERYGYTDRSRPDYLFLCGGNGAYVNHSHAPNMKSSGDLEVAIRDIKSGEELTCNYGDFDAEFNPLDYPQRRYARQIS